MELVEEWDDLDTPLEAGGLLKNGQKLESDKEHELESENEQGIGLKNEQKMETKTSKKIMSVKKIFKCPGARCTAEFDTRGGVIKHIKSTHRHKSSNGKVQCLEQGCNFVCSYTTVLQQHLTLVHDIPMEHLELEFSNYEEFENWKQVYESGEVCRFVKKSGARNCLGGRAVYLYCSRSGTFVSRSKGQRFKKMGSSKMSAHCTALIKYTVSPNGTINASICTTHYGHKKDHRYLRLTKSQKTHIAEKIKSGMSEETVLDSIKSTFVNKMDKIHLINNKDLHNIRKCFHLPRRKSCYKDDDNWIESIDTTESPIVFYKNDQVGECRGALKNEDKCLILITKSQKELFNKFCNNGVLYITSQRTSPGLPMFLVSLYLMDDFCLMFPVCFMICNSRRVEMYEFLFWEILNAFGPIHLRGFATDNDISIHESWCKVMGPGSTHLIANRYCDTEWRKHLSVIENEHVQGEVYDMLYDFIETRNGTKEILINLVDKLRESAVTYEFSEYLKNYIDTVHLWSTHYLRDSLNLDDPIDYETMYAKITSLTNNCEKYGKSVKFLVRHLMRLYLEMQSHRNVKVANHIKSLISDHKQAETIGQENVFPLDNGKWKVVEENASYIVTTNTCYVEDCVLQCEKCGTCMHRFRCNCITYADCRTCCHAHAAGAFLRKIIGDNDVRETIAAFGNLPDFILDLQGLKTDWSCNDEEMVELGGYMNATKLELLAKLQSIGRKIIAEKNNNSVINICKFFQDLENNVNTLLSYTATGKLLDIVTKSKSVVNESPYNMRKRTPIKSRKKSDKVKV